MVETIGFPVTANQSSAGDYLPIDSDTLAGCTVTNSSAYAVEYSTGGAWTTIAAGGSATINTVAIATTSLRFRKKTGDSIPVVLSVAVTHPGTTPAQLATDAYGEVVGLNNPSSGGLIPLSAGVSTGYFVHAYAPNQVSTDDKFYDLLAISDGGRGANLSVAQLWANAGYASTLDPTAGVVDSGLAFPALDWNWNGGESLLIFWRGKITPEGANTSMMGQAYTNTQKGWQIRALATGQADLVFRAGDGATAVFATSVPNVAGRIPFVSGEDHSFMLAMDGLNRIARWYVDGELATQAAVAAFDCRNNTHATRLGSAAQTPTTADGLATQTKALAILKGRTGVALPGNIDTLARRLHRSPYRLITADMW